MPAVISNGNQQVVIQADQDTFADQGAESFRLFCLEVLDRCIRTFRKRQ